MAVYVPANLFQQGYRYHKFRKRVSQNFIDDTLNWFLISRSNFFAKGLSVPDSIVTWSINSKGKYVRKTNFSDKFRRIIIR